MARPKGSKNKQSPGLSFNKRMKVLQSIINDNNQKTCDRLQAIKTMTDMLSDKVKESTTENPTTTIKLEDNIVKKPDIVALVDTNTTTSTTTTIITQPIKQEEVKEISNNVSDTLNFHFTIDKVL